MDARIDNYGMKEIGHDDSFTLVHWWEIPYVIADMLGSPNQCKIQTSGHYDMVEKGSI